MNIPLSNIVPVSDVQKNYRMIFNRAKKTKQPVIITVNNKPEVAVVDIKTLEQVNQKIEEIELANALEAIRVGEEERKQGKLKVLEPGGLANLLDK